MLSHNKSTYLALHRGGHGRHAVDMKLPDTGHESYVVHVTKAVFGSMSDSISICI